MTNPNPTCTERKGYYTRKSDGRRVVAGDWSDGDVSWRLDPIPLVLLKGHAAGTCSAKTFSAEFERRSD